MIPVFPHPSSPSAPAPERSDPLVLATAVRATGAPTPVTIVVTCGPDPETAALTVLSAVTAVSARPDIDPHLVVVSADSAVGRAVLEPLGGDVTWVAQRTDAPVRGRVVDLRAGDVMAPDQLDRERFTTVPLPRGAAEGFARTASPRAVRNRSDGIPRTFHRVWLGPAPVPERYERYWQTWKDHHPTWEFVTWRDADLPRLINAAEFDAATTWAGKADIARYELLLRYGGVYVDADFECLKPVDALLDGCSAFAASEDDFWVSIGIMGGIAGHPWFWSLVDEVPQSFAGLRGAPTNELTGPVMATRTVEQMPREHQPRVFERSLFYPYGCSEPERAGGPFPDAYGVHHWGASWV